jgi:hypothetical protein
MAFIAQISLPNRRAGRATHIGERERNISIHQFIFAIHTKSVMNYAITQTLLGYASRPVEPHILKHNGYFGIILSSHQTN